MTWVSCLWAWMSFTIVSSINHCKTLTLLKLRHSSISVHPKHVCFAVATSWCSRLWAARPSCQLSLNSEINSLLSCLNHMAWLCGAFCSHMLTREASLTERGRCDFNGRGGDGTSAACRPCPAVSRRSLSGFAPLSYAIHALWFH